MNPARTLALFLIIIGLINSMNGQIGLPPDAEAGKCYAKCYLPPVTQTYIFQLPVFIGEDSSDCANYIRDTSFLVHDEMKVWKKIKVDTTCLSIVPEDCLVWCLIDKPEEYYDLPSWVTDTFACNEFVLETFEYRALIEERGFSEYREVLCRKNQTAEIHKFIQWALVDEGYLGESAVTGMYNPQTKRAIEQFQRDHNLPIGGYNTQTLEFLGIYLDD